MIGKNILRLRKEKGLTQAELANKAGVISQTIYKYEKGIVTNIPSDVIERIAYALEVSPAEIMGWNVKPDLTPEARVVAEKYMSLNETNKLALNATLDALLETQQAMEKNGSA